MNWLKSELVKMVLRTALASVGGFILKQGWLSNSEMTQLGGAVMVLAAIAHHLWAERAAILAEIDSLLGPGAKLLLCLALPVALLAGCAGTPSNPGYHVVTHTSLEGGRVKTGIPIPMTGGTELLYASIEAGIIDNDSVVTPTSTNVLHSAKAGIWHKIFGKGSGAANYGSTNAVAGVGMNGADITEITIGDVNITSTNATVTSVTLDPLK